MVAFSDRLKVVQDFTALNALVGYWQVPISYENKDKTTLLSKIGTYCYICMPFGIRKAFVTFQHVLDIILYELR